jgi:DNA (cytosine-5)-methyltransferase 1|tara:strand:+ start:306 stop:926 length:621 start_codon:yes stop_codon:yes gene_type:complete
MINVLNLYAGLGGNRKLWENVSVVAIESDPKIAAVYEKLHPTDDMFVEDAHALLLDVYDQFDFIWSSPPCQSHSAMTRANSRTAPKYAEMDLYQQIIFLQTYYKGYWVVENVKPYYKPLIPPTCVVGRHYFWSNFPLVAEDVKRPANFINVQNLVGKKMLQDWLDIHFDEKLYYGTNHDPCQVLRNCVHPLLGKQIFDCIPPKNIC